MAKLNTSYDYADIGVAINRSNGQPLDDTTIWKPDNGKTALECAKAYAQKGQAYVGQIISVIDTRYDSNSKKTVVDKVTAYIIKDENGNLEEVGASIIVDTKLDSTSTNPVQNKAVNTAISEINTLIKSAGGGTSGNIFMIGNDGKPCWGDIEDIIADGDEEEY